jgi:hypothetical protein
LPLVVTKGRAEPDAPAFVVELTYLARSAPWTDKGQATIALPRLDMPVSRTGLLVVHSPRFEATAEGRSFRPEPFAAPASPALRASTPAAPEDVTAPAAAKDEAAHERETLVAQLRSEVRGGRAAGILPLRAAFPEVGGPWLFLAAELTPPDAPAELSLSYKRSDRN